MYFCNISRVFECEIINGLYWNFYRIFIYLFCFLLKWRIFFFFDDKGRGKYWNKLNWERLE